jgi:three-Cys-motif partner protein
MTKDIHKETFDESTFDKLKIFQDYTREWLPVFIMPNTIIWKTINIVDFFAGPGEDASGNPGSPQLILKELSVYSDTILKRGLKVNVFLNEFKKKKFDVLKTFVETNKQNFPNINIEISNLDFKAAFANWEKQLNSKESANLLFFDQNGIKHMTEELFKKVIQFKCTDFLFFVSSSHARRFCEHENINQYLKLKKAEIDSTPFYHIHRLIQDYYKALIPPNFQFYLGRFSLKKETGNINGLIFGSSHVLGMEKFLKTAWKLDPERGEANYDIDKDEIMPGQINLFSGEVAKPKKIESFENELRNLIKGKKIVTDREIYLFSILSGILPSNSGKVLKEMQNEKLIKPLKPNLTSTVCKKDSPISKIEYY